eukprot:5060140-Pyramimonas_sp.AAC.1
MGPRRLSGTSALVRCCLFCPGGAWSFPRLGAARKTLPPSGLSTHPDLRRRDFFTTSTPGGFNHIPRTGSPS